MSYMKRTGYLIFAALLGAGDWYYLGMKTKNGPHGLIKVIGFDADQERKLKRSRLAECFHHIEILSSKEEEDYRALLNNW